MFGVALGFHIQLFVIMLKGLKVARSTDLMLEALMPEARGFRHEA